MSMGYDEDDPRAASTRAKIKRGTWTLQPGERPSIPRVKPKPSGARPWHGSFSK